MSKQKSTKTETQRFSGPELSELLDQVARKHGADAAIQAVNKIRSGGVAGFFCREEFEVVVQAKTPLKANRAAKKAAQKTAQAPKSDIALGSDTAPGSAAATPAPKSDIAPSTAALARPTEPAPSFESPIEPVTPTAPVKPTDDAFAGPRPLIASETQDRFRALLERRLDDATETEFGLSQHVGSARKRAASPTRRSAPVPASKPEPNLQPVVPAPGLPISQPTVTGGVGVLTPAALSATSVQASDFWLRLQRVQHELASFMPLASTTVATIGPLSLTTPIVRQLRTMPGLESADVIVLTDRAEIVSEPSWQLVRSGHQLVDTALEQGDWPTLILIDVPVELPNWVAPLENRLRIAGVGLFRYAVPGNPTAEQLDDYRIGSDVPYVIDLISRVRPESLVEFIEERHPIASVFGADLNAELLLAMREQVAIGS